MPMKSSLQVTLTQLDEIQPAKLPVEKLWELQQAVKDQQKQHATGVQERVASALGRFRGMTPSWASDCNFTAISWWPEFHGGQEQ